MSSLVQQHRPATFNVELQGLRGLAIFFVICYHMIEMIPGLKTSMGLFGQLVTGGQGVDLFFVVSGYVITKSMYRHIDHAGKVNLRDGFRFWIRRACRTLPPALIWLGFVLAIAIYTGWYGPSANNLMHAQATALQYANFFNMQCGASGTCGVFSYYWSLSLEEQFYLFLPIVMLLLNRRQLAFLMLGGGLLAAVLLTDVVTVFSRAVDFSRYQPVRTDGLMFGVALALFESNKVFVRVKLFLLEHRAFSLLLCLCAHLLLWTRGSALPFFSFTSYISAGTSAAMLVLIGISCKDCVIPNRVLMKVLAFFGDISFSMYLSHIIIIYSVQNYMGMHGYTLPYGAWYVPYVVSLFLVIILVSLASHRLIEAPFQKLGRKLSNEKMASTSAGARFGENAEDAGSGAIKAQQK